jgi:hypothetical protein
LFLALCAKNNPSYTASTRNPKEPQKFGRMGLLARMHGLKKRFLVILLVGGLVGCYLPSIPGQNTRSETDLPAYQTVAVILTKTRAAQSQLTTAGQSQLNTTETPVPYPTATQRPSNTVTLIEITQAPQETSTVPIMASVIPTAALCNLAQAGRPIDVTVSDGMRFHPGDGFVKTWRLVNAGTCPWTQGYAVVWFSGDDLGLRHEESFRNIVPPGESIDLSVDMAAPAQPGAYQSNWKLRSDQGELFGIGPGGGSPFWVRIEVYLMNTSTPTPLAPSDTPTPVVLREGGVTLTLNQSLNLENGQVANDASGDLQLKLIGAHLELVPFGGTRIINMGARVPIPSDCVNAPVSAEPITLGPELEGNTLCLQTGRGQPGNAQLGKVDLSGNTLELKFALWSVP